MKIKIIGQRKYKYNRPTNVLHIDCKKIISQPMYFSLSYLNTMFVINVLQTKKQTIKYDVDIIWIFNEHQTGIIDTQ